MFYDFHVFIETLAVIALVLTVISFVLFYIFARQRVFPMVILGWQLCSNVISTASLVYIFSSSADASGIQASGNTPTCRVFLALDSSFMTWDICCNTLLAVTLYLAIEKQVSLKRKDNPQYYRNYLSFILGWVFIFAVVGALLPQVENSRCAPVARYQLVVMVPNLMLIAVQGFLLIKTTRKMLEVIKAARSTFGSRKDQRLFLLALRTVPTLFAQLLNVIPQYEYYLSRFNSGIPAQETTDNPQGQAILICLCLAAIVDALILVVTNRELWKHIRAWASGHPKRALASSESASDSNTNALSVSISSSNVKTTPPPSSETA